MQIEMDHSRTEIIIAEHANNVTALRDARTSGDASLRTLALGALSRLGELDAAQLVAALVDEHRDVRVRALELAIHQGEIDLVPHLSDPDDLVVETAAWAIGEREEALASTVAALCEVATTHDVSICREAAIAALGALGSPDGLDAILAGLNDRAPVRRRAVLALAPFDGPEVRAALEKATTDRDRQVRQAAEDLL